MLSLVCRSFLKRRSPQSDQFRTAIIAASLTAMWMHCLLRGSSILLFLNHFHGNIFAGYWKVAKHRGFNFFCVSIRVSSLWISLFVLLIPFWHTVNTLFAVLSWYIYRFILLWYFMAHAHNSSLIPRIKILTTSFVVLPLERHCLSPARHKYELPYGLFLLLLARLCPVGDKRMSFSGLLKWIFWQTLTKLCLWEVKVQGQHIKVLIQWTMFLFKHLLNEVDRQ